MKDILTKVIKFVLFFGMGLGILYYVYYKQSIAYSQDANAQKVCMESGIATGDCTLLNKTISDIGTVNWFWMFMLFAVYIMSNVHRAWRWKMLIRPLGVEAKFYNVFLATIIGYAVNLVFPRAGEVAKPAVVAKYEKLPLDRLLGTIVVDRAVDMVCLFSLILLTLALEFEKITGFMGLGKTDQPTEGNFISNHPILFGMLVAGALFVVLWFVLGKTISESAIVQKVKKVLLGFLEGIKTVGKVKNRGWFIFHSVGIWVMYYLMVYFSFFAFPPIAHLNSSLTPALLVFIASTLGMLFPSPGGMGVFHATIVLALTYFYGISESNSFSLANIIFIFVQSCNIVLGIAGYFLLMYLNKAKI